MPDENSGRPTWRDLNDLRDKTRAERRDNTAQIRREIAKVDAKAEQARATAENTRDVMRKILWSFGGGTAVAGALVTLWALVIHPLLALVGTQ